MSNLYIAEYAALPQMSGGQPQIAAEPRIATQKVSYTGTPGLSAAFNAQTNFIGITSDGIFSYAVGTSPTAAVTDFRIAADAVIFMAVTPAHKISAITNT